jgi:nicotinic acid phosphoribosyltransferase
MKSILNRLVSKLNKYDIICVNGDPWIKISVNELPIYKQSIRPYHYQLMKKTLFGYAKTEVFRSTTVPLELAIHEHF